MVVGGSGPCEAGSSRGVPLKGSQRAGGGELHEELWEKYGRKVLFVTDGGKWYPWAAESLGARWIWLKGGVRSYVERWFRTIKDRLKVFNCAFPWSNQGLERARTFIRFYAYYYNHVRPHQSLNQNTPIPSWKATRIQRLQKALEVTKSLS